MSSGKIMYYTFLTRGTPRRLYILTLGLTSGDPEKRGLALHSVINLFLKESLRDSAFLRASA
jgi:hypothetical protein